jgi:hypothetical protein
MGDKLMCMMMRYFLWAVRRVTVGAIMGACVVMLWACASAPSPSPSSQGGVDNQGLVRLSVKDEIVENGKKLEIDFREVERTAAGSIAEVTTVSGGSVTSSLFTMRGMCAVTRARGEKFFSTTRIASSPNRYSIVFPQSQSAVPGKASSQNRIISLDECQLMGM